MIDYLSGAVVNNKLADIETKDIWEFKEQFYEFLDLSCEPILRDIKESGQLTEDTESNLVSAIDEFKERFLKSK